jgi:hypothetical protein
MPISFWKHIMDASSSGAAILIKWKAYFIA